MFFKVKEGTEALRIFKSIALALEKSRGKNIFDGAVLFGPDPLSPLTVAPNNYLFLIMFHLGRNEEDRSVEMLHALVSVLGLSSSPNYSTRQE